MGGPGPCRGRGPGDRGSHRYQGGAGRAGGHWAGSRAGCVGSRNGAGAGADSVGSRNGADCVGSLSGAGSGLERAPERTAWAPGTERALERTPWAPGAEQALERTAWAPGAERALERTARAPGAERALERTAWAPGAERAWCERTFRTTLIHFFDPLQMLTTIYSILPFKSLGSVRFLYFLRESLLLIKAVFIQSKIQKKNSNIVKSISNIGVLI